MEQEGVGHYKVERGEEVTITVDPRDGASALVRANHNGTTLNKEGAAQLPEFRFVIQGQPGDTDLVMVWYEFLGDMPGGANFKVTVSCSHGHSFLDRRITNSGANGRPLTRTVPYEFEVRV